MQKFTAGLLVSNSLFEKLVASLELPIIFDVNLNVFQVSSFVAGFNIFGYEFSYDNFTFTLLYWAIFYIDIIRNQNKFAIVSLQYPYCFKIVFLLLQ